MREIGLRGCAQSGHEFGHEFGSSLGDESNESSV